MQLKEAASWPVAPSPVSVGLAQPAPIINLATNENALGPSPRAVEALSNALTSIHRYPDAASEQLRCALAERAGLPAAAVVCGNGSDELIFLLCLAFLRPADEVIMAEGTFISYGLRAEGAGARVVRVPLQAYTHDLQALADAITPRTRIVFLCNPNNPTGTTNGAAEMQAFLARVPENILVVVDEAYIEYVTRPDYPCLLDELRQERPNLLLLRTFAKIYGLAGLRLGYAYAHPKLIDALQHVRPLFNVNALAQIAGMAALNDSAHVTRSREAATLSRDYLVSRLTALGLQPIPSETNFIALPVGDDQAVAASLRAAGVLVSPLSRWGLPGCIRISFGTAADNHRFVSTLADVLAQPGNASV